MARDLSPLLEAWLRYQRTTNHADFWAVQRMSEIVAREQSAEAAWAVVSALIARAPDDLLGAVAAGPLEDLVSYFAPELIDRIETAARRDPRTRSALARIWITHGTLPRDVERRIVAASNGGIRPLAGAKRHWHRRP